MGAAKQKKIYNEKVNRAIWILLAQFGLIEDQFEVIKGSSKHSLTQDDINTLTAANNLLNKLKTRIYEDEKTNVPFIQLCSEQTKKDYNYFYSEMQKKIDELNDNL